MKINFSFVGWFMFNKIDITWNCDSNKTDLNTDPCTMTIGTETSFAHRQGAVDFTQDKLRKDYKRNENHITQL
ncbi:hypothetical protein BpHYR1_004150 [Brachionus plicatilis]|uniref:Uncharacterized protein n=1 Tax=Brachionus plicatilis TaxID=10195 RepID=A0A3M7SXN7_BRAPC|nr:hypothetical protein BpHYR1_004150 [Brachionus plicatilis]